MLRLYQPPPCFSFLVVPVRDLTSTLPAVRAAIITNASTIVYHREGAESENLRTVTEKKVVAEVCQNRKEDVPDPEAKYD